MQQATKARKSKYQQRASMDELRQIIEAAYRMGSTAKRCFVSIRYQLPQYIAAKLWKIAKRYNYTISKAVRNALAISDDFDMGKTKSGALAVLERKERRGLIPAEPRQRKQPSKLDQWANAGTDRRKNSIVLHLDYKSVADIATKAEERKLNNQRATYSEALLSCLTIGIMAIMRLIATADELREERIWKQPRPTTGERVRRNRWRTEAKRRLLGLDPPRAGEDSGFGVSGALNIE